MKVDRAISDAIFHHQLEGFRDYPRPIMEDGKLRNRDQRFLEVFNESVVSVEHAEAIMQKFESAMPTLEDIRNTARNLRPQFESAVSQREQWEREYGPARAFEANFDRKPEREIDKLWKDVLAFFRTNNFDGKGDVQKVHIGRCWQIAQHFGYPINSYQQREIEDYERIYPRSRESLPPRVPQAPRGPQPSKQITQADFDALQKRDGKLRASGDDGPVN